jgi:uncharacterized protein YjbI with pentapeptide repeats
MLIVMFSWFRRLLAGALASMAIAGSALACSCGPPMDGRSASQKAFDEASFVGLVTMIGIEGAPPSPFCGDRHRVRDCKPRKMGIFTIERALKGSSEAPLRISLDYSQCTIKALYGVGEQGWIAVFGDPEIGYFFGSCTWFEPPSEWDGDPVAETVARYQAHRDGLEGAVRHRPDPRALMELAKFLAETHSRLEAISVLDQVLTADRLHPEANVLKAQQLAIGPRQQAVIASLAPYLAAHPDDQEAMHQHVLALVRLDRLDEVPANWRDFRGLNGIRYDFSNRKLDGASFRGNIMYGASFVSSELRNSDFSGTTFGNRGDFSGADLTGALMTGAGLGSVKFQGAVLDNADLSGAYLGRADLRGASLKGANLSKVDLGGVQHDETTIWPDGFKPDGAGTQ